MKVLILFCVFIINSAFAEVTIILPTKFGDTVFQDILILDDLPYNGITQGTLEVPGGFKVLIENGKVESFWHGTYIKFMITVTENNEIYKVFYFLFSSSDLPANIYTGNLKLEDGKVIGEIKNGHFL